MSYAESVFFSCLCLSFVIVSKWYANFKDISQIGV